LEGELMALILPPFRRILGKAPVIPGSFNYGYGTYSVIIPDYNTLTMKIWGAGGGGAGVDYATQYQAGAGGTSSFAAPSGTIIAGGGGGAIDGLVNYWVYYGTDGADGGGSGGDVNTTGGGNAGGAMGGNGQSHGGTGGRGGFVQKTWTVGAAGAPIIGATYTLVCGPGGGGAPGYYSSGGPGANASATLSWT
jgi:hypothetical protein